MEIRRIDANEFLRYKDIIAKQLDLYTRNDFPDYRIDENNGRNKCDELEHYLVSGSAVLFAALQEDELTGFAWCHPIMRFQDRFFHVAYIIVLEACRGQGIGNELMEHIEAYAKDNGYLGIDLFCTASNKEAESLYRKKGFVSERYLMTKRIDNVKNTDLE